MNHLLENTGLNEIQISLLRMFNRKMSIEESEELRDLLHKFYAEKAFDEVEKVVLQKKISEADYQKLRNSAI